MGGSGFQRHSVSDYARADHRVDMELHPVVTDTGGQPAGRNQMWYRNIWLSRGISALAMRLFSVSQLVSTKEMAGAIQIGRIDRFVFMVCLGRYTRSHTVLDMAYHWLTYFYIG